jgi:hypothetical protein
MDPVFVRFFSAVKGRLVSRFNAPQSYLGARRATPEERAETGEPLVWDEDAVFPFTAEYCRRYDKEIRCALNDGDLRERTEKDYLAWVEEEKRRDAEAHPPPKLAPTLVAPSGAEVGSALVDAGGPGSVPGVVETTDAMPPPAELLPGAEYAPDAVELPESIERTPSAGKKRR